MTTVTSAPLSPIMLNRACTKLLTLDSARIQQEYANMGLDVSQYIKEDISLWQCPATGYRFYHPFDIFGDAKFYEELQEKHQGYYPADKFEHRMAIEQVQRGEKILEVGCGPGHFLSLCKEKGAAPVGLEFNDKAIDACTSKGLEVHKSFIHDFAIQHPAAFDTVCFFQVLEHIAEVKPFLDDCIAALKRGGRLMIAVPNSNPYLYKTDLYHAMNLPPHHAGLWDQHTFEQLPQHFPLTLEYIQIEKLNDYKIWFAAQRDWHLQKTPWLGKLLSAIPRPLYKMAVRMASPWIEGRNIFVVYRKL